MEPKEIFRKIKRSKRKNLTEIEARKILIHYKIPVVKGEVIKTLEDGKKFAERVGYPLVLKVVSRQIIHKTDVGGVILNIRNEKELYEAYHKIIENVKKNAPGVRIDGFFIQKMMPRDYEVFVGGKKDPTFGQTIAFGFGGIFIEVFEDVSFRIVPIAKEDAMEMIREVKAYEILKGLRGKKPADLKALVDILLKTSRMLEENGEIKELDINPIFALQKGAFAGDARIIIE